MHALAPERSQMRPRSFLVPIITAPLALGWQGITAVLVALIYIGRHSTGGDGAAATLSATAVLFSELL